MMVDRRLIKNFHWGLLAATLALAAMGVITLYSAVNADATAAPSRLHLKQMLWYVMGLGAMSVGFSVNYKTLERWAPFFYGICVLMLVAVLVMGQIGGGSRRWLVLGPVFVQPSELAKIAVALMLARHYAKEVTTRGFVLHELIWPMAITGLPFLLIVRQPDLGTAMLVLLIALSMTFFVKIERRTAIGIFAFGAVALPVLWHFLKGYQKERILTFLDPGRDPLGAGYHIIQSKIAIGSGMLTGKGFLKGTQNALSFLPEQHTDFIFSVLAEEWGFAGGLVLLVVFLLLLLWGLSVAAESRDPFGIILAVGLTAMIFWHVTINIGMVMGLMPVVGVPLPFISYGGSSLITTMLCVGLLINIRMRRFIAD
ncbi:MAG: rod shape-determining protein RodA [Desulfobacterales bacterium]|jgi:rod shape determining protein RodA|nr:rod shape-determining protein RodA [Desulfobacterales bacterium]